MPGPAFHIRVRLAVGRELILKHGYRPAHAAGLAALADDETIDQVVAEDPTIAAAVKALDSAGNPQAGGAIIAAILAFLASPIGQQLIAALIAALLGGL